MFSFGASATAKSISFVVSNDFVWPTSVTVGIYLDAGGTVGANVYNQTFSTFVSDTATLNATDIISVNLGNGVALGSGNYIVFLTNGLGLSVATFEGGSGASVYDYGATFSNLTDNPYASLSEALQKSQDLGIAFSDKVSAIPEPSTWVMLLFGFVSVSFSAFRRGFKPGEDLFSGSLV